MNLNRNLDDFDNLWILLDDISHEHAFIPGWINAWINDVSQMQELHPDDRTMALIKLAIELSSYLVSYDAHEIDAAYRLAIRTFENLNSQQRSEITEIRAHNASHDPAFVDDFPPHPDDTQAAVWLRMNELFDQGLAPHWAERLDFTKPIEPQLEAILHNALNDPTISALLEPNPLLELLDQDIPEDVSDITDEPGHYL